MKIKLFVVLLIILILAISGCATAYKPIVPPKSNDQASFINKDLELSYKYDILGTCGNKKYSKKTRDNNIRVAYITIKNKTEKELSINKDINFLLNGNGLSVLEPDNFTHILNQNTIAYLFYGLLTTLKLYIQSPSGKVDEIPIGFVIGPGITLLNLLKSSTANNRLKYDLNTNNLMNKTVAPGETVSGTIAFNSISYQPITIELRK